jgi:sugar phosphate isomerase/epimerase
MTNPIVSVQLYSLRSLGDLDAQLDAAVAAGFTHVELLQGHVEDAPATNEKLAARGLQASSAHLSMDGLRNKYQLLLDNSKQLGLHHVFMPAFLPAERVGGSAHWADRGRELGILARRFRSQGVRLGYHNHDWEFRTLPDGSLPIEHLFANSGDSLFFELDIAWVVRGGADVSEWLERLKGKLLAVHVKDLAPHGENTDEGGWADVGAGTIDWPRYWQESLAAGAKNMVVEHDHPLDPAGSVTRSAQYIRSRLEAN